MLQKICPRCGKSSRDVAFIASLCKDCYLQRQPLYTLPELDLDRCVKCGRIRLKGLWLYEPHLPEYLKEKIKSNHVIKGISTKMHVDPVSKLAHADIEIKVVAEGQAVTLNDRLDFRLIRTQCPECGLRSGGYHEAIIQLRGNPEKVERLLQKLIRRLEARTFISKIVHHKEGPDIQVGKKRAALETLSQLNVEFTMSNKLVGEHQNKQVFRTTACVRLD